MTESSDVEALVAPATPREEVPAESPVVRRRGVIVIGIIALISVAVALAGALAPATTPPSLDVFERVPTEREREIEDRVASESTTTLGADAEARVIVDVELESGRTVLEVWALRGTIADALGRDQTVVCLTTAPTGPDGDDLYSCMEEHDVERRGFIPLDQPRPRVVVDGELRVIEWGPTGDARIIEPPKAPRRAGSGS